jgi:predicted DNA-binding transcriptional regulator AlpA
MDAQRTKHDLPVGMTPRGLSRVEAAAYIGLGTTKFDELVGDGRMPRPRVIGARKVWDRIELDAAFADLPHEGEDERADVWAKVAL